MSAATEPAVSYEIHPLAHLMPAMRDAEYEELREDIAANGLHEPISLFEGKVLDGRHRYRACEELGLYPTFSSYEGDAPAAFVLSLNVKRRQLTQSQKAMLATDFLPYLAEEGRAAQARAGRRFGRGMNSLESSDSKLSEEEVPTPGRSAQRAAEQVGVGHAQVVRANRVKRESPELADQVRRGETTVTAAYAKVTGRSTNSDAIKGARNGQSITRDGTRRRPAAELIENVIGMVEALPAAIQHIDVQSAVASTDAPLADWDKRLTGAITALVQLRKQIRGAKS